MPGNWESGHSFCALNQGFKVRAPQKGFKVSPAPRAGQRLACTCSYGVLGPRLRRPANPTPSAPAYTRARPVPASPAAPTTTWATWEGKREEKEEDALEPSTHAPLYPIRTTWSFLFEDDGPRFTPAPLDPDQPACRLPSLTSKGVFYRTAPKDFTA